MNLMKLAALAALFTIGTATADDVEKKMEIKVVVAGDVDGEEVNWTSDGLDFELDDLEIGESRTLENGSGEPMTVTRTEDGLALDVGGETIVLPDFDAHGAHMAFVDAGSVHDAINIEMHSEHDEDVNVRVMGGGTHAIRTHGPKGVTIISGNEIDASVQETIRSVLISAGHDDEVTFIDRSSDQPVRIIEKRIEIKE